MQFNNNGHKFYSSKCSTSTVDILSHMAFTTDRSECNNCRIKRLMQESPLKRNNNYYDDEERALTCVRVEGEDGQSTEDQGSIHGDVAQSGGQNPHPHTNPMVIN